MHLIIQVSIRIHSVFYLLHIWHPRMQSDILIYSFELRKLFKLECNFQNDLSIGEKSTYLFNSQPLISVVI